MSLGTEMPFTMNVEPAGSSNGNNGGWGGDWGAWIVIFLIFAFCGWGGNGFGGFGGGNGASGALTRGDLCMDMNFNGLENSVRGIQQGICDSTFALNNTITNGFHGVDNAICNLGFTTQQGFNATQVAMMQGQNALQTQLADCCCTTQRAIDGVNYNMATNTCNLQNTMNTNARDIIDSQNAGTRAILDYLCQDKISTLQSENQALRLAASQDRQNALLTTTMTANTAQIIGALQPPTPVPAYQVPNPLTGCCNTYTSGCGC